MINLRNQQVNVNRIALITALKTGLTLHQKEYQEAVKDYKAAVKVFLEQALSRANKDDFENVVLRLSPPVKKDSEYLDVIEMLEVSVDDNIQLDKESYKAFYKNEWSWSDGFKAMATSYKTILGVNYGLE